MTLVLSASCLLSVVDAADYNYVLSPPVTNSNTEHLTDTPTRQLEVLSL